jgi:hypothetical protein
MRRSLPASRIREAAALGIAVALVCLWNLPFLISARVGIFDWTKDAYYYAFLKACLCERATLPSSFLFPPEVVGLAPTLRQSLSYWANPEVMTFSPLLPLLCVMPWVAFVKLQLAVHLGLGAFGTWLLCRRLGLASAPGGLLFALCFLHPWLMQHLAIGYLPWMTACLAPWIVAELLAHPFGVRPLFVSSAVCALILYEGGLHIFLWLWGAVALFAGFALLETRSLRSLRVPLLFFTATALLCLPKFVAIHAAYADLVRVPNLSYASATDLWGLLTDTTSPVFRLPSAYNLYGTNFYDASLSVGIPYLALLLASVISLGARVWRSAEVPAFSLRLLAGAVVFLLLGWGGVWARLASVVPVLGVERSPWRFLALSFALLNVLVAFEVAHVWRRGRLLRTGIVLMMVAVLSGFHGRQQLFLRVATSQPAPHQDLSLEDAFARHLRAARYSEREGVGEELRVRASLSEIEIEPPGEAETGILVRWLLAGISGLPHLAAFRVENAEAAGAVEGRLLLRVLDPERPVVIRPRSYGRGWLLLLGICAYGAMMLVAARRPATAPRARARAIVC